MKKRKNSFDGDEASTSKTSSVENIQVREDIVQIEQQNGDIGIVENSSDFLEEFISYNHRHARLTYCMISILLIQSSSRR
jgi:hypothetical protein